MRQRYWALDLRRAARFLRPHAIVARAGSPRRVIRGASPLGRHLMTRRHARGGSHFSSSLPDSSAEGMRCAPVGFDERSPRSVRERWVTKACPSGASLKGRVMEDRCSRTSHGRALPRSSGVRASRPGASGHVEDAREPAEGTPEHAEAIGEPGFAMRVRLGCCGDGALQIERHSALAVRGDDLLRALASTGC